MTELKSIIENFTKLEGVEKAVAISPEGELIEGSISEGVELLIELFTRYLEYGRKIEEGLNRGDLEQCYLEYGEKSYILEVVNQKIILAIVASVGTNLGRIRYEIRRAKKLLEASIGN